MERFSPHGAPIPVYAGRGRLADTTVTQPRAPVKQKHTTGAEMRMLGGRYATQIREGKKDSSFLKKRSKKLFTIAANKGCNFGNRGIACNR
jgi:hypothetical protein